jgi:hypothetical protein
VIREAGWMAAQDKIFTESFTVLGPAVANCQ